MSSSQSRFDPVLCDLDGTLVDSTAGIVASIEAVVRADGVALSGVDLASLIGLPLDRIFAELAPVEDIPQLICAYRRDYESRGLPYTRPMPGAVEAIGELHRAGVRMAVVTHKPLVYAERILETTGLRRFFLLVVGQAIAGRGRSKADLIEEALSRLGAPSGLPVYVGDHSEDRSAAHEASIHFLPYGSDDWPALTRRLLSQGDG